MDEETRNGVCLRLKNQLQALSMPADVQLSLLPDFCCKADELALDFGHWSSLILKDPNAVLTKKQRSLLLQLDRYFEQMSGQHHSELWTDDAIRSTPEWERVRTMAIELLDSFGWAIEPPKEPI